MEAQPAVSLHQATLANRRQVSYWLLWTLASAFAGLLTGYLEAGQFQFAATLIFQGFIAGAAQWLVLRPYLARAGWWIPATGLGMFVGWLLWIAKPGSWYDTFAWLQDTFGLWEVFWLNAASMTVVMLVAGAVQWLILRRDSHAGGWLLLSLLGGMLMGSVAATASYAITFGPSGNFIGPVLQTSLQVAAGWTAYGLLTGWWIAKRISPSQ
jgi:hypothetical protein